MEIFCMMALKYIDTFNMNIEINIYDTLEYLIMPVCVFCSRPVPALYIEYGDKNIALTKCVSISIV